MDKKLLSEVEVLQGAIADLNSEKLMKNFARIIEESFCDFGNLETDQHRDVKGRAHLNFRSVKEEPVVDVQIDQHKLGHLSKCTLRLLTQMRRLDSIKACVAKNLRPCTPHYFCNAEHEARLFEIRNTIDQFKNHFIKGDPSEEALDFFDEHYQDGKFNFSPWPNSAKSTVEI